MNRPIAITVSPVNRIAPELSRVVADIFATGLTLPQACDAFELRVIETAIDRCGGSVTRAARTLGLHRNNLAIKRKQLQRALRLSAPAATDASNESTPAFQP